MALSRSHLIVSWVIMELNMLIFISIIAISQRNRREAFKYFIIQRVASRIFLVRAFLLTKDITALMSGTIVVVCILVKLGAAPFHV